MDDVNTIKESINTWEEYRDKVKDKKSVAYLDLLNSMRHDYEELYKSDKDNKYEIADKCIDVCKEMEELITHGEYENGSDVLLASYDTRARMGDFEAYCIALEWNRPLEKQFYLPRKRILRKHGLIQALQDVSDDKLDFLFISTPPRVGKSTLGLFFLTFRAGLYPERSILGNGHSSSLAQSFYSEVLNVISSDEYRYNEIFPDDKVVNKNAEYNYVDLNKVKRFHTLMFKSIDGGTTGLAEASNILYCDDLIKDVEQANNPSRLEKLFYTYTSTIQDRVISRMCRDGVYRPCPEIHIATRWSLNDVIGRLISIYQDSKNERLRIINIPCYDENGESNFMYDFGKGFDKEYYHHLQLSEDPVIFAAKYLGEPIEREGLVFEKELLNYYTDLPNETPDRIVAYADVSHGGADYFSLPVAYVYGYEVYIEDVFFEHNFGGDDYSRPRVVEKVINHNVGRLGIEVANGGDFYASLISNDLKNKNYRCSVTTHKVPTTKSKLDRILACQNEIKGIANENKTYRLYFKDLNTNVSKEYKEAMNQLFSWNQNPSMQNKQHDDFPDSLAGLITNLLGGKVGRASSNLSLDKLGL